MADFNLTAKEGGYQERPQKAYSNIDMDGDVQKMLLGVLGSVTDAAISKAMSPKKEENPALGDVIEGTTKAAELDLMGASGRKAKYNEEMQVEMRDKYGEGHAWQVLNKEAEGFVKTAEEKASEATDGVAQQMKKAQAKADQRGENFNYRAEVYKVYLNAVSKYGPAAATEAFHSLHGTSPLKFMSEQIVDAEKAARTLAVKEQSDRYLEMGKSLGITPKPNETSEAFADRTMKRRQEFDSFKGNGELLQWMSKEEINGNPVDPKRRAAVEQQFAAGQGTEYFGAATTLVIDSGFDVLTATDSEKDAIRDKLRQMAVSAKANATSLISDSALRAATIKDIEDNTALFMARFDGSDRAKLMESDNLIQATSALREMRKRMPGLEQLKQIDKLQNLLTTGAIDVGKFKQIITDGLLGPMFESMILKTPSLAINSGSPEQWMNMARASIAMAKDSPAFAEMIGSGFVDGIREAYDPYTKEIKDPKTLISLMNVYAMPEFLTVIMPQLGAGFSKTAMGQMLESTDKMLMKLSGDELGKNPVIKDLFTPGGKARDSVLIVDISPAGNLLFSYKDAAGKAIPLSEKEHGAIKGPTNTLAASIRARSHFQGHKKYEETLIRALDGMKLDFGVRLISGEQYKKNSAAALNGVPKKNTGAKK